MSELQIPFEALRDQINSAIDVIVQVDRFADGGRRVSEVAVVASHRRETFRLASVMEFETEPIGPDRRVRRRARAPPAAGRGPAPADAGRRRRCRREFTARRRRRSPSCDRRANELGDARAAAAARVSGAVGVARAVAAAGRDEPQRRAGRARAGRRRRGDRAQPRSARSTSRFRRTAERPAARRRGWPGAGVAAAAGRADRAASSASSLLGWVVLSLLFARVAGVRGRGRRRDPDRAGADRAPPRPAQRGVRRAAAGDRADARQRRRRGALDPAGARRWPRASWPTRRRPSCARGRRAAGRAVARGRARAPARPAALARGRGADDHDRDPAARGRRHRARAGRARPRRWTPARTCGARSRRCSRASCSRPTSWPGSAAARSC